MRFAISSVPQANEWDYQNLKASLQSQKNNSQALCAHNQHTLFRLVVLLLRRLYKGLQNRCIDSLTHENKTF